MRTLLLSLLLTTSIFAKTYQEFAKDMNYETDYQTALQKAKKENKELMVFMIANFCPWCIKFEKKVLSKEKINTKIHQKYIPLILNREEGKFPKMYETPVIPTAYFVDAKNETIKDSVVGYHNRAKFIDIVNQ